MKTGVNQKAAALDKVIGICSALGANYSPSEASLQPTALKALLALAQARFEAVTVTHTAYAMALNAQADSFAGIPRMAAQIARFVSVSKPKPSDLEEVKTIKRRFYAASRKTTTDAGIDDGGETKPTRTISWRDKRSMLESFRQLIQVVEKIPGYKPNEADFKVAGLKTKLTELKASIDAVSATSIAYREALIARDEIMHSAGGVIESTRLATDYIRAKYGFNSIRTKKVTMETHNV
jgi:hypothetical protein